MYNSDEKLHTKHIGPKTRQTAHWDLDYMTMKQREGLVYTTKRNSPKKTVNMPIKRPPTELEQRRDLLR